MSADDIALVAEALDYYFVPGEHHDRPNLEGHAALGRLDEEYTRYRVALREITEARSEGYYPITVADLRDIARAALSGEDS